VHLQLKTNVEPIGQDPFDNLARIDPTENRREQNGVAAFGQIKAANLVGRPFVVLA